MRITWYGHSTFRIEIADATLLVDPFFTGNPAFEGDVVRASEGTTHILLTHGHDDHVGDTAAIAERTGAKVVAGFELCMWLGGKGVKAYEPMNTGGTTDQGAFRATFVRADHSATMIEGDRFIPLGNPHGIVVAAPGEPSVYAMGDTAAFGDMALIQERHAPAILLVPIGDRFTMGADEAAFAIRRFFRPQAVIPCHYGSFPLVDATADRFVAAMEGSGVQVVVPQKATAIRFTA